jgi:hypothetical protein
LINGSDLVGVSNQAYDQSRFAIVDLAFMMLLLTGANTAPVSRL